MDELRDVAAFVGFILAFLLLGVCISVFPDVVDALTRWLGSVGQ